MTFLIRWLAFCFLIPGVVAAIMNFDRIAVLALREIETPFFREAWAVAELIYRRSEPWQVDRYELTHPKVGRISHFGYAVGLSVSGPFGEWRPNFIERRIIWNAIAWRQRASVMQAIGALG